MTSYGTPFAAGSVNLTDGYAGINLSDPLLTLGSLSHKSPINTSTTNVEHPN